MRGLCCRSRRRVGSRLRGPQRNRGGRTDRWGCVEDHIDPEIRGGSTAGGESAGTVLVDAIGPVCSVGQSNQRRGTHGIGERSVIGGVVSVRGVVRNQIGAVSLDGHRRGEVSRLPAREGLAGKGDGGEQLSLGGPEMTHMGSGIVDGFEEAHSGDVAIHAGDELHAHFNCPIIVGIRVGWLCGQG